MKHILVVADPIEEPQRAIAAATELARNKDCKIHIVGFCFVPMAGLIDEDDPQHRSYQIEIIQHRERWWHDYLAENTPEVEYSHEVVWERYIHHWIESHCARISYDLIVKTGHRSENLFYTPSDWQLFRESKVPVYIVRGENHDTRPVVLAAVDLLSKNSEKQRLNEAVIEGAFRLSVHTAAELHLCHTIKIPAIVRELELVDVPARVQQIEAEARAAAKPLLEQYDIGEDRLHIHDGDPGHVIPQVGRKLNTQCIVMGSMGRTGIAGKLIGNTCEKVLHNATTDLMVIGHR